MSWTIEEHWNVPKEPQDERVSEHYIDPGQSTWQSATRHDDGLAVWRYLVIWSQYRYVDHFCTRSRPFKCSTPSFQSLIWGLTVRSKGMTKGMMNRRGVVVIVFVSGQISSPSRRTTNPVGFALRIQACSRGGSTSAGHRTGARQTGVKGVDESREK